MCCTHLEFRSRFCILIVSNLSKCKILAESQFSEKMLHVYDNEAKLEFEFENLNLNQEQGGSVNKQLLCFSL